MSAAEAWAAEASGAGSAPASERVVGDAVSGRASAPASATAFGWTLIVTVAIAEVVTPSLTR